MTTFRSAYEEAEERFRDAAIFLLETFCVNVDDLHDIISDQLEEYAMEQ